MIILMIAKDEERVQVMGPLKMKYELLEIIDVARKVVEAYPDPPEKDDDFGKDISVSRKIQ